MASHAIGAALGVALLSAAAQAGVEHTHDPETGLEAWILRAEGASFTFNQRLPDQTRAYFQGRGFRSGEVEAVALACVFQVTVRNDTDVPIDLDLSDWRVIPARGSHRPLRLEADWQQEWQRLQVAQPARVAFRWSLFPTRQSFQPGDWNMGMVTFDLEPGTLFDLEIDWHQDKTARHLRFQGMRCAPDRQL
ncbi:hypothetical protein [Sedimenticola selenatireducens]|uniref:hypothetical protein n=1 Tax=Sedimenticola selenatireducens TaxID=191960 RepID=UPI0004ADECCD|nr:hypothetical protein [Sedimenticola selenatireducens]